MSDALWGTLTDVFRDTFDDEDLTIGPETTADDVDGWDSLTHIRLMLSVERAFGIKLSASEIGKLKTVGDLAGLVTKKKGGAS
jgi:acyl carrier protein